MDYLLSSMPGGWLHDGKPISCKLEAISGHQTGRCRHHVDLASELNNNCVHYNVPLSCVLKGSIVIGLLETLRGFQKA